MVELNPSEGIRTNVTGTRNVADAVARHGALAMIQVSSDKAVNPCSVMGASKRLAEMYCQALDLAGANAAAGGPRSPRFMTVRFGNVLGSSGSVVPLFRRQLARGGPLTVTHPEIRRYFMTVREAVELVLQASAHGLAYPERRGQIFVLDMGQPIKIADLARQMIRLAGLQPDLDVRIEYTGLRPGEKLYEELFDATETRLPSVVDGVFAAVSCTSDPEALRSTFAELAAAAVDDDRARLRLLLSQSVPGYQPFAEPPVERANGEASTASPARPQGLPPVLSPPQPALGPLQSLIAVDQ
jgi:O-antigen biosynthesis protein WbqV